MKVIVTVAAILAFAIVGICSPYKVYAGKGLPSPGDSAITLALIGGAAYLGYHFSQHYEVKKKAALEVEDGKVKLLQLTLHVETVKDEFLMAAHDRYSLNLVNINF